MSILVGDIFEAENLPQCELIIHISLDILALILNFVQLHLSEIAIQGTGEYLIHYAQMQGIIQMELISDWVIPNRSESSNPYLDTVLTVPNITLASVK